jgi:hypothetical protein
MLLSQKGIKWVYTVHMFKTHVSLQGSHSFLLLLVTFPETVSVPHCEDDILPPFSRFIHDYTVHKALWSVSLYTAWLLPPPPPRKKIALCFLLVPQVIVLWSAGMCVCRGNTRAIILHVARPLPLPPHSSLPTLAPPPSNGNHARVTN